MKRDTYDNLILREDLRDFLLAKISELKTAKVDGRRAPHKPLLILLALASIQHEKDRLLPYKETEKPLKELLVKYGVSKNVEPQLPFWHLRSDEIWEVPGSEEISKLFPSRKPSRKVLTAVKACGGFNRNIYDLLKGDEAFLIRVAQHTLDEHFTVSLHKEILDSVGLSLAGISSSRARDPKFRKRVLDAYGWKCSICEFDMYLGGQSFGLEAAHIRWKSHDGSDEVMNGVALCANHHKAFDHGALTIADDFRILISEQLHGGAALQYYVERFSGQLISLPHSRSKYPEIKHLKWHHDHVFRGPPKDIYIPPTS